MLYCGRSCRKYKIKNTTLKTAVMALAKRYTSAGKALLRSPARESIVKAMVGVLKRETRCIRRKDSLSLFTARRKWALMHFTWSELFEDIKAYAPTLCELLCSLVPLNKRVRAIRGKQMSQHMHMRSIQILSAFKKSLNSTFWRHSLALQNSLTVAEVPGSNFVGRMIALENSPFRPLLPHCCTKSSGEEGAPNKTICLMSGMSKPIPKATVAMMTLRTELDRENSCSTLSLRSFDSGAA